MVKPLGKPIENAVDGENNPVHFDFAYPLHGTPAAAIQRLGELHGEALYLLPISGSSCGGGIMQAEIPAHGKVIGLRYDPPVEPRVRQDTNVDLAQLDQDEVVIDIERGQVLVGAAITLDQLNRGLCDQLGSAYRVFGADLTSYQYAAVGATFMTGGMGPQRRYFSDSVIAASIFDGRDNRQVEGEELLGYAGTYGWTGLVTAVACRIHAFPQNEIAFTLPVSDDPQALARVLARLGPFTDLDTSTSPVQTRQGQADLLLGIEHVSCASMQPLVKLGEVSSASRRALDLRQKCAQAGADGLLFINGLSNGPVDEYLLHLVDDAESNAPTIAGIALEHAELFNAPEEMRELREAIPYAARMQTPDCRHLYKNHTDAVVRIHPGKEASIMAELWQVNRDYVTAVKTCLTERAGVIGDILVYGHLNPQGVDPHNRITMGCDDFEQFEQTRDQLLALRSQYYRSMAALCESADASFIGGEKTADSEREIFAALGGPHNAPEILHRRYQQQRKTVRNAAPMFNWRALDPYR